MSKFKIKKLPPIRLIDLLKKRKTNLKEFIESTGITAYVTLEQKCSKMGVSPPSEEDFLSLFKHEHVSSPQEGIIVLDPPDLTKETGEKIRIDEISNLSLAAAPFQDQKLTFKEEDDSISDDVLEVSETVEAEDLVATHKHRKRSKNK